MTFAGLTTAQMLTLFGMFAGGMVLLYILKLRRRRVEVPFSPLWARVVEEKQTSSLFKALKRLFSLLLQLVLLALIVGALGDPELSGASGCNYEPPKPPPTRHSLIMLDASASMSAVEGGRTRIERARKRAHEIVEDLGDNPNHRAMIVQMDALARPLSLWTADRDALHAAIDAYAPNGALDTPTSVDAALELAERALLDREEAELVMITDRAFAPIDPDRRDKLGLKVEAVGSPGVNIGIQALNMRPYLDDSLKYAIFYSVRNDSDRPLRATLYLYANEDGRSVEDFIDDAYLVGSQKLELPAGGSVTDLIDDFHFPGSRLAARVEIAAEEPARDIFPRDDVAFALVPERRKLKVQLVTEGNLFLHATLFVRENVEFEVTKPADYTGPEGHDITVVDGAKVDMSKPGAYFVLDPQEGGPFEVTGTLEEPELGRVQRRHPIVKGLKLVDLAIAEAVAVTKERGDKVVVATSGGSPLVLTREDAAGKRAFVMVAFDIRKSLLPLNYAFPLLVVNVLNWFYQEADGLLRPNRAGIDLSLAFPLQGDDVSVTAPKDAGEVRARRVADRVHMSTDRIGIYELTTTQAEIILPVAINLMSPSESQLSPQGDYATWQAPALVKMDRDPWLDNVWRILLCAFLGLIVLEWLTWHRRLTV